MAIPSPVKFTKNGVEYTSNVDRTKYTIKELSRAALKDVGKLICRGCRKKTRNLKGMGKGKRAIKAFGYWVRKIETDLLVGTKQNTWYGAAQELGGTMTVSKLRTSAKMQKLGFLAETTRENIDEIQKIEGKYLSAVEDANRALGLVDESEEVGDGE